MSTEAEKFLAAALELAEHDRAEIAARLLESLTSEIRKTLTRLGRIKSNVDAPRLTAVKRSHPIGMSSALGSNGTSSEDEENCSTKLLRTV